MKAVLQIVKECSLNSDGIPYSKIGRGFLILLGVGEKDTKADAEKLAVKAAELRVFSDENGKMNYSCIDSKVQGQIMVVSNFTLYADCRKGRRPDFFKSAKPNVAKELYEYFVELMRAKVTVVKTGVFGSHMEISMNAEGPVTIILDSTEI